MKKFILSTGLMLAAAVTFAGSPKGETKEATTTENTAGDQLVWYKVTYDAAHPTGYIPSGSTPVYSGDKAGAEALNECEDGSTRDCLRGFNSAPPLPSTSNGIDQVKTDELP